jgi:Mn2+/Fe2+ NRAMP family transporter
MWLGLGMLGLGILSYGVGQTGLQVVAPDVSDELERQEWWYVIRGVIGAVIGGLMAFIGAAFMFMEGAEGQPSEAE